MRFPRRGIDFEFDFFTAILVLGALGTAGFFVATVLHHRTTQGSGADAAITAVTRGQRVTVAGPAHTVVLRPPVVRRREGRRVFRYVTETVTRQGATHVVLHPVAGYRRVVVHEVVTRNGRTTTVRQTRTVPVTVVQTRTQMQTQSVTSTVTQRSTVTQPVTQTVVSTSTQTETVPTTVTVTVTKPGKTPPPTTTG